jgi:hypothetical protein
MRTSILLCPLDDIEKGLPFPFWPMRTSTTFSKFEMKPLAIIEMKPLAIIEIGSIGIYIHN